MTAEEYDKLTDEEIQAKVQALDGWERFPDKDHMLIGEYWGKFLGGHFITDTVEGPIPDYLNDLNAMHEITSVMGDKRTRRFSGNLIEVANAETNGIVVYSCLYDATAAQRCKAFVLTMTAHEEEA